MVKPKSPKEHSHLRLWLWSVFDGGKNPVQIEARVKMLLAEAYAASETHMVAHEEALKIAYEEIGPCVVWLHNHGTKEIEVTGSDSECSKAQKFNKIILSHKAKLGSFREKWNTDRAVVLKTINGFLEMKTTEVYVYLAGKAGRKAGDVHPEAETKKFLDSVSSELTNFHDKLFQNIDKYLEE